MSKQILFLTGTRADFGKIKSLIKVVDELDGFEYQIFVTGMHLMDRYGQTFKEIEESGFTNINKYFNQYASEPMDLILANTINGLSRYVHEMKPDAIVVHGDRVEALAGAIVGSLNNIRVIHIEGGERSGTIDDLLRHSITKLSHVHLVANSEAQQRVLQLGECDESIHIIGSADIDYMKSDSLPTLVETKDRYKINFDDYHIILFHPVTTEVDHISDYAENLVDVILESEENFVVIYPNNDSGTDEILRAYKRLANNPRVKIFPSIRFEYFLTLIHCAKSLIGNSSAGIREAPIFGVPSINIGTRQSQRFKSFSITDCSYTKAAIKAALDEVNAISKRFPPCEYFGSGDSAERFQEIIASDVIWKLPVQKEFCDVQ